VSQRGINSMACQTSQSEWVDRFHLDDHEVLIVPHATTPVVAWGRIIIIADTGDPALNRKLAEITIASG